MRSQSTADSRASIPFMLISAALFLYFGFGTSWNYTGVNGEFLLFVALLDWTLKITGVLFALCVLLLFVRAGLGHLLYAIVGLASAIMLAIVAVMDILDPQHIAMSPVLLILFALWNGYGSWCGLRELRSAAPDDNR